MATRLEVRNVDGTLIETFNVDDKGVVTNVHGDVVDLADYEVDDPRLAVTEECPTCGTARPETSARVDARDRALALVEATVTGDHDAAEAAVNGSDDNIITGVLFCLSSALADGVKQGALSLDTLRAFLDELLDLNTDSPAPCHLSAVAEPEETDK